jgi:hypothetical protein
MAQETKGTSTAPIGAGLEDPKQVANLRARQNDTASNRI